MSERKKSPLFPEIEIADDHMVCDVGAGKVYTVPRGGATEKLMLLTMIEVIEREQALLRSNR